MRLIKIFLFLTISFAIGACKHDKSNLNKPPVIKFTKVRVIDNLATPVDTFFLDTNNVTVHSGAKVEFYCETTADGNLSQMDINVYGLAKDASNHPIDTAYLVNSFGTRTNLLGIPKLDWPNTSFREGFYSEKMDKFKIVLPKITDKTDVVLLISDEAGLSANKTITIRRY